jgi:hypothetical protein
MDKLMDRASANGHDFRYHTFIMKSKFGTCRNQGDIFGVDRHLYRDDYHKLSELLTNKSSKISEY